MNRDELAALPIYYNPEMLPEGLIGAGAASDLLGISEHQLYGLMQLDVLKPVARLNIEHVHWWPGKPKWSELEVLAFEETFKEILDDPEFENRPDRMYAGPVAHLIADDPDDGPPARGEASRFVELDWPRPYCGVNNLAESWRGRTGRFWEMEKAYTMRVCKGCIAVAADPSLVPEPREQLPQVEPMSRFQAVSWLLEHVTQAIEADWQASEQERELDARKLQAALLGLDVTVSELRQVARMGAVR